VGITLLLEQYRRQRSPAFQLSPAESSFRGLAEKTLISVHRVERSDGSVLHVLLGDLYHDGNYYCVLYPRDRSTPVAQVHQYDRLPDGPVLSWRYQPRKRDNRNTERRSSFERLMGDTLVRIDAPSTVGDVERFLRQLFRLAENRMQADCLEPAGLERTSHRGGERSRSYARQRERRQPKPQPKPRVTIRRIKPRSVPISRLVIQGESSVEPWMAEAMLLHVLDSQWPVGLQAMFLQTPGGFVSGPFPADWSGGVSWGSQHQDFADLLIPAQQVLARTVTERVLEAAKGKVRALTIGISLARAERPQRAELVAFYDIASRQVSWTGNSFPAKHQERDLFQIIDLDTHLIEAEEERILVLGSYDLSVYNPRANPSGLRRLRCTQLRERFSEFAPTIALHHPLWTDTPRMWLPAWTELEKELPSVKTWASGICYHSLDKRPRGRLRDVLVRTTGGKRPYDFVVVSSGNWAEAR
jgi:hypothetical protein